LGSPEEAKNLAGQNVLRLIQIRLASVSLRKISSDRQGNSPQPPNRRFEFQKRSQLFVGVHNETFSVVPVGVSNPDRSPFGIHG
jgi:hypothetical protein